MQGPWKPIWKVCIFRRSWPLKTPLFYMNLIDKPWKRTLLSLFAGGLAAEIIVISLGDPTHRTPADNSTSTMCGIVFAVIAYFMLTALSKRK